MVRTMPNTTRAMTPDELRELMAANGLENGNQLAIRLEVSRSTVSRWLNGERRIDRAAAALIKSVLPKKPKK